jgi:hypothetical protein
MPIYSKSGKHYSHDFKYQKIKTLDQIDYTDDVIFYHHPYDTLQSNISLYNCLDDKNWDFLRNNPQVKLLHNNDSETFEITFVADIVKTIKERNINPQQLHIVVMDENHKQFLEKHLLVHSVTGIDINVNNYLLNNIEIPTETASTKYKFSSLSRNYRIWRLFVYAKLADLGLLNNFNYSFHNIHPYNDPPKIISFETMLHDLDRLQFGEITSPVTKWLKRCPHELASTNEVLNKWSNVTYDTIRSADFHLIIETHFDQKEYVSDNKIYSRDFAPSSITEKAYKPIACSTPFIAFATPNWLEDLKNLGFKTYSPYINEDYDKETDNLKRLNMIVDEINRICSLDENSYVELVNHCKEIAKENLKILKNKQNAHKNI